MVLGDDEYQRSVESLSAGVDPVRALNNRVAQAERRTTRNTWLVILDIGFSVLFAVGGFFLYKAVENTQQTQAAQKASCISGNQYRAADLKRWNLIVSEFVVPGRVVTPAESRLIDRINRENAVTDAQRNCNAPAPKVNR